MNNTLKFKVRLIKNEGNYYYNLENFIKFAKIEDYKNIIRVLEKRDDSFPVLTSFFPTDYTQLLSMKKFVPKVSFKKMLLWNLFLISYYKDEIGVFIEKRKILQSFILNEEYVEAEKILDEIEAEIGVSVWSLQIRILLYKKQNKSFSTSGLPNVVGILADWFDIKVDDKESYKRYRKKMNDRMQGVNHQIACYFYHKLEVELIQGEKDWENVLFLDQATSLVDIYLSILDIIASRSDQC